MTHAALRVLLLALQLRGEANRLRILTERGFSRISGRQKMEDPVKVLLTIPEACATRSTFFTPLSQRDARSFFSSLEMRSISMTTQEAASGERSGCAAT